MKKILLSIMICILLLTTPSCKKEETIKQNPSTGKISDRKQNIINLLKQEMIEKGYLDSDNLKSLDVLKIYIDGYYKSDSNNKNIEIDFKYTCKDKNDNCIQGLNYYSDNDYLVVWIYTDNEEKEIYSIKQGIGINKNDIDNGNYVRVGEIVE